MNGFQDPSTPRSRPLIAIPARFTANASAIRYRGDVVPRALLEAVFAAGGEPLMVHPSAPEGRIDPGEVAARLAFADGVLLPGGGDLSPRWTKSPWHETHYDVDEEQDGFDLAIAMHAVEKGLPLLAICRGMQVLNVALGGTLRADMNDGESVADHFHRTHRVSTDPGSLLAKEIGDEVEVSCYHHQCVDQIAASLRPVAASTDGTTEALETQEGTASGWLLAVQWHPEDTALVNSAQMRVFEAFIEASRGPQDGIDA